MYLFSWLDPLFFVRFKKKSLDHSDLYAHPSECDAGYLHQKFMRFVMTTVWMYVLETNYTSYDYNVVIKVCIIPRYWSNEKAKYPEGARLWLVLLKCFWWRIILNQILTLILVSVFIINGKKH